MLGLRGLPYEWTQRGEGAQGRGLGYTYHMIMIIEKEAEIIYARGLDMPGNVFGCTSQWKGYRASTCMAKIFTRKA
jgi:hypothetical protein